MIKNPHLAMSLPSLTLFKEFSLPKQKILKGNVLAPQDTWEIHCVIILKF